MNKLSFDDYSYHAWTTAYYLDKDPGEQFEVIHYGFNEELGELITDVDHPLELTSKLWGRPVPLDISRKFDESRTAEAGDILYFISAAGLLRNIALRDIAKEAIERYTGTDPITWDETIGGFDSLLKDKMASSVPEDYKPDYPIWRLWDFAPFENGLHIVLRQPTHAKGPLTLIPDGRYALERLHNTFGRSIKPEMSDEDEFIAAASLALGSLSIVLQSRFNSSLADAARNSISKRERRQRLGTLENGIDAERSRKLGQKRHKISDEESTQTNLLNTPLPS